MAHHTCWLVLQIRGGTHCSDDTHTARSDTYTPPTSACSHDDAIQFGQQEWGCQILLRRC